MDFASYVCQLWDRQVEEFLANPSFRSLEAGSASEADYDRFLVNVFRTHQNSPQLFGFLLALCGPDSFERVAENLLEEMGVEEDGGESHPALMLALLEGAGLEDRVPGLRAEALGGLRETITAPFPFASLRQMALSTMVEVFAYEYMLAHQSVRIAGFLREHRGMSEAALVWFTHHGEVDIRHANEALETLNDTVSWYEFSQEEARAIADGTLAENTFVTRYFAGF